ncbi:tail fiber assembly protein [Providencia stuartii]|uniref:Tail fiber protein of prophage cp-933x n=2 Tax=Enterobacterales TaxID=91347 RepID=A0A140NI29_PROSM|nr:MULTISPECIES: tail fiber assembly protein [Providencia]AFH92310.1 tail fiber protein of prophage cp-933x [Providencia stuartii MRSN 2154]MDE8746848.1 tail fiber assembly protein [Providencia thailandensis]MDE8765425.1 tail fiber assembly protein [Providencia thailandensis]MDE8778829.1 tail fiber assembly protein [Providencia thailandensis]MDE8781917.1 tail fiber assembly protein [Providencia thailandensis]
MSKYNLDIITGVIGQDGYVSNNGWVKTYYINEATREYIGATMEYVTIGGGLPAGAYLDAPELPEKPDVAIIRSADEQSWLHVADHRGKTAYNTETRQPVEVDFIGDLPETLTLLEPKTEFDAWNGKKWVTDTEAQKAALIEQAEQEKSQRLDEANNMLTYLQDSIDTGLATDEEAAALQAWKKYRVLLNRVDTSLAPNIEWPEKP